MRSSTPVPHVALTRCLGELTNYVVLRNEEDLLGNVQRGGDIDLLVQDLALAEATLIRTLGIPVRIIRSSYVSGYSYDWGHIDLLPTIEWRGACYLRTDTVLENRRVSPRGRPVPRIAHEALISWLTNILFGGFFKERYAAQIRRAVEVDGRAFRQALVEAAGKKLGLRLWEAAVNGQPEISAKWTWSLRLSVWWRAWFKSPLRTMQRSVAFVAGELRLRFQPRVPWVAFLGQDRIRTSSVAQEIVHRFRACPYGNVKVLEWRSDLLARPQDDESVVRQETSNRRSIGSTSMMLALAADWRLCYWSRWVHLRAKGCVLAFEHSYFDVVVGATRQARGAGPRLPRAFWWLVPKPDLVFLLDSETDTLAHRDIPARQLPAVHVFDGNSPITVMADEIQRVIRAWISERSVALLGAQAAIVATPTLNTVDSSGASTSVSRGDRVS